MNVLARWGKFNAVGAMGVALQLGALAVINRLSPGHYLWATLAALEITLLHNFAWHVRWTWRDRRGEGAATQCWRFHVTNGAVSLVGNVMLMRLLVEGTHWPVLAANAAAIACCSIVNFALAEVWAFSTERPVNP